MRITNIRRIAVVASVAILPGIVATASMSEEDPAKSEATGDDDAEEGLAEKAHG